MRIKPFLIFLVAAVLYACQSSGTSPEAVRVPTVTPTFFATASPTSEASTEVKLWNVSAHANTYEEQSANTYCARCHSPLNWKPTAGADDASSISMGEWQNIPCETCHRTEESSVSKSLSWWDQTTGQYQAVADSTELCVQCHRDVDDLHYQVDLDNSPHASFGCISCHDPHSLQASCSNAGCHAGIRPESSIPPSTPTGGQHPNNAAFCGGANCHPAATQAALSNSSIHGATHASVSCVACHDASGLAVGPSQELGVWITFQTKAGDGVHTAVPYNSHEIQKQVDCSRCHFEENPWQLPAVSGKEFGP